jgi:hypothetical protein
MCDNSTLFAIFKPFHGKEVTRQTIVDLWQQHQTKSIPQNLHSRVPEIVEFCLMMWQRQQMQQGMAESRIEIFQRYHFCNNYRELDRGTAYFRSQVLQLAKETNLQHSDDRNRLTRLEYTTQVLAMAYYYRLCNKIESFRNAKNPVGGIPRFEQFDNAFVEYVQSYNVDKPTATFFTRAHLNQGFKKYLHGCKDSTNKIPQVAQKILESTSNGAIDRRSICKHLKTLDNVGPFMAWQIACDLEESSCYGPCIEVSDNVQNDDYVELGPGAKKGLCKIFGDDVFRQAVAKKELCHLTMLLRDSCHDMLQLVGKTFPLWKNRPIHLKMIEHALCEFQKFVEIQDSNVAGQRMFHSRASAMDKRLHQQCSACSQTNTTPRMIRCDTCHFIACESCQKDQFYSIQPINEYGYTCCQPCRALDQLSLR